jgi:3-hydroxypropionyl-CoA synthetase (ADP-forming)
MRAALDPAIAATIDALLGEVHRAGRDTLYEHEVYRVLAALGLATPTHVFLPAPEAVTPEILGRLASRCVVLKAAAPQLTHKHQAGGVRVVYKDLDFVRYAAERMLRDLSARGWRPEGFLLAECIEYSKDLGNEVLLGFRESEAFGPVISFSKGGTDAEHFAAHFSPPNLILAPMDRDWAQALLASTHIQKKYAAEGHGDYVGQIVAAGVRLSELAMAFSGSFPGKSRHVLHEFEVNPLVFDGCGRFLAIDGFARLAPRPAPRDSRPDPPIDSLAPFFEPRGIAVVGVSTSDAGKPGSIILRNLARMGREDLHAVNVKGGTLAVGDRTLPVHRAVADIPAPVDLAVVAVPAEQTLPVVEDCARKGVKALVLITGGFSEVGRHREAETRIAALAREAGMRVIGPNCLGIVYSGGPGALGINTFFVPEEKFQLNLERDNNVAILSQSGALGITEIYNLRNAISPRVIVSYGNQLDVDPADLVAFLDRDPAVDVIGCYIEGFKSGGGRKFFDIAAACRKPIVVYKAGRTQAGRKATESHTASIAGEYAVAKAALKQAGLIVADTMMDHGDFIKTFALLHDFAVGGNRVAVIANAGYEKTYAADNLGDLRLAEFTPATVARLRDLLPPVVEVDPLLDLTPMAGDDLFERCIDTVLASAEVDALFISIVPHSGLIHTTDAEIDRNGENIAARIVRLVRRHRKPAAVSVCVVSGADAVYNKFAQVLDRGGVPTFLEARRAMACLNAFVRYRLTRDTRRLSEWLK